MRSEITRLMVEVAVGQGLRELRGQSHRRALRNLVEHGGRYSKGAFQRRLFGMIQEMLRSDEHPYYELCSRAAQEIDDRYIMNFCVNMGFESWTKGARTIRRLEGQTGCNVPWALTVHVSDTSGGLMPLETLCGLIDQGMAMGVMSYMLVDPCMRLDLLRTVSDLYPRCALVAFLLDDGLDGAALDALEGTDNLMLVGVRQDRSPFVSGTSLREHHRIYGLCRSYDDTLAEMLMASGDLRCPGDPDCLLPYFMPEPSCSQDTRDRFNAALMALKDHPRQALFPIDVSGDMLWVDRVISTDGCALTVTPDGSCQVGMPPRATDEAFPAEDLADIFHHVLRKDGANPATI